jgi:hypothetical protein
MAKFKSGDQIIDRIGRKGVIRDIVFNSAIYENEYVILWSNGQLLLMSQCIGDVTLQLDTGEEICWHDWVDYKGFNEDYRYCKKCDTKE